MTVSEQTASFTTTALDLKDLLKNLAKHGKKAAQKLADGLESKDEKIAQTAAIKLLELQVEVAKQINNDQLNRLVAQVKLGNGKSVKEISLDEDKGRPLVDFATIQEVK